MPIATPEVYADMLDRAKAGSFAYPAINCTSSETINAAIKGFADESGIDAKAYETIAQAMGGAMSTTGWRSSPPTASSAVIHASRGLVFSTAAIRGSNVALLRTRAAPNSSTKP